MNFVITPMLATGAKFLSAYGTILSADSLLKNVADRFPVITPPTFPTTGAQDQGKNEGMPPADAPSGTWGVNPFGGIFGPRKTEEQIAKEKEEAVNNEFFGVKGTGVLQGIQRGLNMAKLSVIDDFIAGYGLRATFLIGGGLLTIIGVIFMLREAAPNQTADFGEKLADQLTGETKK